MPASVCTTPSFIRHALICCAFVGASASLAAQGPPPGVDPAATWSDAAVAESLKVLARLDSVISRNKRDAAAWFRRGMISWGLMHRSRVGPPYRGLDWTLLSREADSSLRIAESLDSRSTWYQLRLAQYMLGTGQTAIRTQAYPRIHDALRVARRGRDTALLTEALIEEARISWRFYDAVAHQHDTVGPPVDPKLAVSEAVAEAIFECHHPTGRAWAIPDSLFSGARAVFKAYHAALINCTFPVRNSGETDYIKAEALFREAYAISPANLRAFRQFAMLLAEKNRWNELRSLARDRVNRVPGDGWTWMVLGLGTHRSGDALAAAGKFDTALARMSAEERDRLGALQRVLRPGDTTTIPRAAPGERTQAESRFWLSVDPLWSRSGDEPRTEFLARVTYAELRWTVDELGVRGSDSDRGDVFVRYGPPDVIANMHRQLFIDGRFGHLTFWDYQNGLFFMFDGQPTYATLQVSKRFMKHVDDIKYSEPSNWDNIIPGRVHEMPVRMARFRGEADSVDLYLAALAPVSAIQEAAGSRLQVKGSFWLFDARNPEAFRDSTPFGADGAKAWIRRVAPGNVLYRVEATADGVADAARAMSWVRAGDDTATGFTTRGFGISDLLVASRATANPSAARWSDFAIVPVLSPVANTGELVIIWENYDLGARADRSEYEIVLTVQRERSAVGRVTAEIVGTLAGLVGVDRRADRVTYTWSRATTHAAVILDNVTVSLRETPPGDYLISLELTDRVSGRKTSRSTVMTVRGAR